MHEKGISYVVLLIWPQRLIIRQQSQCFRFLGFGSYKADANPSFCLFVIALMHRFNKFSPCDDAKSDLKKRVAMAAPTHLRDALWLKLEAIPHVNFQRQQLSHDVYLGNIGDFINNESVLRHIYE